jgi:Rha family phage regulatory protein
MLAQNFQVFEFDEKFPVRTIRIEDIPWFVAMDLADILEYEDTRRMCDLVDEEDKEVINPHKVGSSIFAETFNSNTFRVSVINESGLYTVIFNSTKKEAKKFKRWVTSKVLPSIRKTGVFNAIPFKLTEDSSLVHFELDDYWVWSTSIAEMFEKEHFNVMRDLSSALKDVIKFEDISQGTLLPVFKCIESSYIDKYGRTQRALKVNRALFNYVVLAYQGDVAKYYRMKFIAAFEELEKKVKVFLTQQMVYSNGKRQQVYILKNTATNMGKVGITNDISRRVAELQNASGCEISVEYLAPKADNAKDIEKELHKILKDYRGIGEWFNIPVEDVIDLLKIQELVIASSGVFPALLQISE